MLQIESEVAVVEPTVCPFMFPSSPERYIGCDYILLGKVYKNPMHSNNAVGTFRWGFDNSAAGLRK